MLKKKNGFTLIELIAVVVIMGIIALIATPNIVSMIDRGKREDYLADANEFISKATYMFKQEKYRNDTNVFNGNKILLKDIENINDLNDPYGGVYDDDVSYVSFSQESVTDGGQAIIVRTASIYLYSCGDDNNCHRIGTSSSPVAEDKLTTDSVKEVET